MTTYNAFWQLIWPDRILHNLLMSEVLKLLNYYHDGPTVSDSTQRLGLLSSFQVNSYLLSSLLYYTIFHKEYISTSYIFNISKVPALERHCDTVTTQAIGNVHMSASSRVGVEISWEKVHQLY